MTIQPAPSRESFQQRTADLRRIGVRDVGAACGPRRAAPAAARIGRVRRTCRDRVAQSSPAWQPVAFVHLDNNAAAVTTRCAAGFCGPSSAGFCGMWVIFVAGYEQPLLRRLLRSGRKGAVPTAASASIQRSSTTPMLVRNRS